MPEAIHPRKTPTLLLHKSRSPLFFFLLLTPSTSSRIFPISIALPSLSGYMVILS